MRQQQHQKHDLEQNTANRGDTGVIAAAISPPALTFLDQQLQYLPDDSNLLNINSIFSSTSTPLHPTFPSPASLSSIPSSLSNDDMIISSSDRYLYLARLTLQYREMEDLYELCIFHLRETLKEVQCLRYEISRLRKANNNLVKQLKANGQIQPCTNTLKFPVPLSLINDLRRLNLDDSSAGTSPTSVLCNDRVPQVQRVSLPKSISVRSNGFAKANTNNNGGRMTGPALLGSQRVYVPGNGKEGEQEQGMKPVELEVYRQGMFKTELCNKWEESGTCPYGDHCQFAHGFSELRPVIRHPRYKTEVCRMVLAGEACPYGHRCHFRHALTPNDREFLGAAAALS